MLMADLYCERLSPDVWAEPLNALSNLGFLLAALWCHVRLPGRYPAAAPTVRLLATLLGLVGLASLSFHTFQSPTTGFLDVAFIGLFNVCYLIVFAYQVLGWKGWQAAAAGAGFLALDQLRMALLPADFLHGSGMYLPPLLVLLVLAGLAGSHSGAAARQMAVAALVFSISLTARTLDQPLCPVWPYGLHFVWHLLNAVVLLMLIRAFGLATERRALHVR